MATQLSEVYKYEILEVFTRLPHASAYLSYKKRQVYFQSLLSDIDFEAGDLKPPANNREMDLCAPFQDGYGDGDATEERRERRTSQKKVELTAMRTCRRQIVSPFRLGAASRH